MTQVILTVGRNWFDGGQPRLSSAQKTARENMTRHLTHNWLPDQVARAAPITIGSGQRTDAVEVSVREFGRYDYRTVHFKIEVGLEPWSSDPQNVLADLADVQDQIQESFKLFLLGAKEWFGDTGMSWVTFRVSCYPQEGVIGDPQSANLITGCTKPVGVGQPIGAA